MEFLLSCLDLTLYFGGKGLTRSLRGTKLGSMKEAEEVVRIQNPEGFAIERKGKKGRGGAGLLSFSLLLLWLKFFMTGTNK